MTLTNLESLKSCQVKLVEKNSAYDYSSVTDSIQRDVENHFSKELPGISWRNQKVRRNQSGEIHYKGEVDLVESVDIEKVDVTRSVTSGKVVPAQDKGAVWGIPGYVWGLLGYVWGILGYVWGMVTGFMASDKQVKVKWVSRIRLHDQDEGAVLGMVVYHQHVYVAHWRGSIVYRYTPDGSLSHKYEHRGGKNMSITGMCLIIDGDTAMLVICDVDNKALVWIRLSADATMEDTTPSLLSSWIIQ